MGFAGKTASGTGFVVVPASRGECGSQVRPKCETGATQETPMSLVKKIVKVAFVLSVLVIVPACNTMHGAGKDLEKGGEKIQDATN